jgi:dethiobiotin synthetase
MGGKPPAADDRVVMAAFFVTGAGTDIGKTWVSAALLRHWRVNGLEPRAVKPVATGYDPKRPEDSDAAALLKALGRPVTPDAVEAMTPIRLLAPLSPDQAASREGAWISARSAAVACWEALKGADGPALIEGAGGVMTPLNESETMLDLCLALRCPAIFVAGSYLGAISHALTGLAVLKGRGVPVPLVLVNETPASPVDLHETVATIAAHAAGSTVLAIPREADGPVWQAASRVLGR